MISLKKAKALIPTAMILFVGFLVFFFRSSIRVATCDDLSYQFVRGLHKVRISNIFDIIASQSVEWMGHSGRFFIHSLTQGFCSIWEPWYGICNAAVFLLTSILLFRWGKPKTSYAKIITALFIIATMIYHCPGNMMFWIAVTLNYMWPMPFMIGFIVLYKKLNSHNNINGYKIALALIFSFIAGATQEAFIVPICLTTALFQLVYIIKYRKINTVQLICCIFFWIGSATVILAPGTLHRGGGITTLDSLLTLGLSGLNTIAGDSLIWGVLILTAYYLLKNQFRTIIAENRFIFCILTASILFSMFVHTADRSFMGVRLYALLVMLKLGVPILNNIKFEKYKLVVNTSLVLLFAALITQQCIIIVEQNRVCESDRKMIADFIASPDGVVEYKPIILSSIAPPYIENISMKVWQDVDIWYPRCINDVYGTNSKKIKLFKKEDISKIANINKTNNAGIRANGTAGFLKVGQYILVPVDSVSDIKGLVITETNRYNPTPIDKVFKLVKPDAWIFQPTHTYNKTISELDTLDTRWGSFVCINDYDNRTLSVDKIQ